MNNTKKKAKLNVTTPTNVFTFKDEEGNKIISTHHGTFVTIHLHLKEENSQRKLGTIRIPEREFHVKRERSKHLLVRANAYGFNHYILDNVK